MRCSCLFCLGTVAFTCAFRGGAPAASVPGLPPQDLLASKPPGGIVIHDMPAIKNLALVAGMQNTGAGTFSFGSLHKIRGDSGRHRAVSPGDSPVYLSPTACCGEQTPEFWGEMPVTFGALSAARDGEMPLTQIEEERGSGSQSSSLREDSLRSTSEDDEDVLSAPPATSTMNAYVADEVARQQSPPKLSQLLRRPMGYDGNATPSGRLGVAATPKNCGDQTPEAWPESAARCGAAWPMQNQSFGSPVTQQAALAFPGMPWGAVSFFNAPRIGLTTPEAQISSAPAGADGTAPPTPSPVPYLFPQPPQHLQQQRQQQEHVEEQQQQQQYVPQQSPFPQTQPQPQQDCTVQSEAQPPTQFHTQLQLSSHLPNQPQAQAVQQQVLPPTQIPFHPVLLGNLGAQAALNAKAMWPMFPSIQAVDLQKRGAAPEFPAAADVGQQVPAAASQHRASISSTTSSTNSATTQQNAAGGVSTGTGRPRAIYIDLSGLRERRRSRVF